jgi:hypothetical protein
MPHKDIEPPKAAQRIAEDVNRLADPVTIEEAFNILREGGREPLAAAALLISAIVTGLAHVWGNGEKVHENFDFERHLRIAAKHKEGGDWTAEMEMRAAVNDFSTTAWAMSHAEVTALLEEVEPQKAGRKRGRRVKCDWDAMVAEVIWRVHEEGPIALASDLSLAGNLQKWCRDQDFKDIPEIDTIRRKLAIWLSRYPRKN